MDRKLTFFFLILCFVLSQDACYSEGLNQPRYAPGEVLVKFKPNVSRVESEALHERLGAKVLKHFRQINVDLVKLPEGWTVEQAIELYQADPTVEYAEPNYIRRIQTEKN